MFIFRKDINLFFVEFGQKENYIITINWNYNQHGNSCNCYKKLEIKMKPIIM